MMRLIIIMFLEYATVILFCVCNSMFALLDSLYDLISNGCGRLSKAFYIPNLLYNNLIFIMFISFSF